MRIEPRQLASGLVLIALAGALFTLPAIVFIGDTFLPRHIEPAAAQVPPVVADALWAHAGGGRATELQPLNPFTVGHFAGCHLLAETRSDGAARIAEREKCMTVIPAFAAVGYLSAAHLRQEGVWQDPRVPFAQIATMTRMSGTWTRAQLIDTLAERAEFTQAFVGIEAASRGFFGHALSDLSLPHAALLAAMVGNRNFDPWCDARKAAALRRRVLEQMRDNGAIDDAALESADRADLGLGPAPAQHKTCA